MMSALLFLKRFTGGLGMHSIKILTGDTRATWTCPVGGDARRPTPQTDNSDTAQPRDDGTVNTGQALA